MTAMKKARAADMKKGKKATRKSTAKTVATMHAKLLALQEGLLGLENRVKHLEDTRYLDLEARLAAQGLRLAAASGLYTTDVKHIEGRLTAVEHIEGRLTTDVQHIEGRLTAVERSFERWVD